MTGKKTVFIVIAFTIIAIILTWFYLEYIIEEYDVDRAINIDAENTFTFSMKNTIDLLVIDNKL